jgi:hypothetical protein
MGRCCTPSADAWPLKTPCTGSHRGGKRGCSDSAFSPKFGISIHRRVGPETLTASSQANFSLPLFIPCPRCETVSFQCPRCETVSREGGVVVKARNCRRRQGQHRRQPQARNRHRRQGQHRRQPQARNRHRRQGRNRRRPKARNCSQPQARNRLQSQARNRRVLNNSETQIVQLVNHLLTNHMLRI